MSRVRILKNGSHAGEAVLYWMIRDKRVSDNFALLTAQNIAIKHKVPLLVCFQYTGNFPKANIRQYDFLFKGLEEGYKPDATVNTSHGSYTVATLVAHIEDSLTNITGGSITGITDITVADGGTGLSTVAKGSILAANSANVLSAVDGGGSTDKFLLYTAASDTVSWTNTVDGGIY